MVSINRSFPEMGSTVDWLPEADQHGNYLFTVTISAKRRIVMAAPSEEEMFYWLEALSSSSKGTVRGR